MIGHAIKHLRRKGTPHRCKLRSIAPYHIFLFALTRAHTCVCCSRAQARACVRSGCRSSDAPNTKNTKNREQTPCAGSCLWANCPTRKTGAFTQGKTGEKISASQLLANVATGRVAVGEKQGKRCKNSPVFLKNERFSTGTPAVFQRVNRSFPQCFVWKMCITSPQKALFLTTFGEKTGKTQKVFHNMCKTLRKTHCAQKNGGSLQDLCFCIGKNEKNRPRFGVQNYQ